MEAGTESIGATTPGRSAPRGATDPDSPGVGPSGTGTLWLVEVAAVLADVEVPWDMFRSYRRPAGSGSTLGWGHERILVQRRDQDRRGGAAVGLVEAAGPLRLPRGGRTGDRPGAREQ